MNRDLERGRIVFTKNNVVFAMARDQKAGYVQFEGQISPILMAAMMWNHGPEMLEKMRKAKSPGQKIDGKKW